ncbi:MAG: hypothetical protein HKO65_08515 [Gemmatimonadetes bacterium]|nr:hypothetical protein [Gemmatimonadota bacterium]
MSRLRWIFLGMVAPSVLACSSAPEGARPLFSPREVVDLGAVVTEDLPQRVWGKALLDQFAPMGFDRQNTFDIVEWEMDIEGNLVSGSNAYYELFNHGGPHIDAPNHISQGGGLDSYPVEVFSGPVKVFDTRDFGGGHAIPEDVFRGSVNPGDVVLAFTGYVLPETDDAISEISALTPAAAEYLAGLPVRAFGTDALSVDPFGAVPVEGGSATARAVPVHHAFLSRAIPVYEELFNMDQLINRPNSDAMYFVGVPLSIKDGDGMLVRPVVFVY